MSQRENQVLCKSHKLLAEKDWLLLEQPLSYDIITTRISINNMWTYTYWYRYRFHKRKARGEQERLITFPTVIGSVLPLSIAVHTPPPRCLFPLFTFQFIKGEILPLRRISITSGVISIAFKNRFGTLWRFYFGLLSDCHRNYFLDIAVFITLITCGNLYPKDFTD